jgi:hypothetical protein
MFISMMGKDYALSNDPECCIGGPGEATRTIPGKPECQYPRSDGKAMCE